MAESIEVVVDGSDWLPNLAPSEEGPRMWDVEVRHDSGVTLRAHKLVLSENSAFFREAFADKNYVDLKEKEDGVSLDTLRAVLQSIYRIPFKVDAENVYELMATANYLQVAKICDDCCGFLKSRLSVENALSTWQEAYDSNFQGSIKLQGASAGFIFENFKAICTREEFMELKPEELKALLSHRPLKRKKESIIVDAVITWLNNTWARNYKEAPAVIAEINFDVLREPELGKMQSVKKFKRMKLTSTDEKLMKLEILESLDDPQRDNSEAEPSKLVSISKVSKGDFKLSEYNLATGEWTSRLNEQSLQVDLMESVRVAFAFQGCVVVVTSLLTLENASMKAHVLKQGRIHTSIPLSIPGDGSSCQVTFSEPFLCLTYVNGQLRTTTIILYDVRQLLPAHEEVSEISAIPVHQTIAVTYATHAPLLKFSRAVYFQDEVYLIGGEDCNEVSVFSLTSSAWRRGPSTHMSCWCCNLLAYRFVVDGVLYSAGGAQDHECNKIFERFDPASAAEGWVKGPELVRGCRVKSHYVRDGRLFLVGRWNGGLVVRGWVVQSIYMDDFSAGWRDDTAFFEDLKPDYAFAV